MDQRGREEFGAYLRSLRDARGMTQREASKDAAISAPYLAQLERGQRKPPSRDVLSRLALTYGVDEEKLLQEAGYKEGGLMAVPQDRIEWAYRAACADPSFTFGTRVPQGSEVPLAMKAYLVEMYQQFSGRQLLTPDETANVGSLKNDEHE